MLQDLLPIPLSRAGSDFPTPHSHVINATRIREKDFGSNDLAKEVLTFGTAPDEPDGRPLEKTMTHFQQLRDLGACIITITQQWATTI